MFPMLCPKFFFLDIKSTSGPLLWIPVIGSRGAGCLPIFERAGLGMPGTIPDKPDNCRRLRALGSVVVGPNLLTFLQLKMPCKIVVRRC